MKALHSDDILIKQRQYGAWHGIIGVHHVEVITAIVCTYTYYIEWSSNLWKLTAFLLCNLNCLAQIYMIRGASELIPETQLVYSISFLESVSYLLLLLIYITNTFTMQNFV